MAIEAVAPASLVACLSCAGARAYARKGSILMRSRGESVALMLDGEALAVAYLYPHDDGRREFCLSIRPDARAHMLALCRFAHSTLASLADHGAVVFCRVYPGNRSGARMARLCGFQPSDDPAGMEWVLTGGSDDASGFGSVRRRRQGGAAGSGGAGAEEQGIAAGGE